jgi:hypothetical protein
MADIAELERRVAALEAGAKTDAKALKDDIQALKTDMQAVKRDTRKNAELLGRVEDGLTALNGRVVANELTATANARTTERGFSEVNERLDEITGRLDRMEAEQSERWRDLPSMIAETMREVLKEQRGG